MELRESLSFEKLVRTWWFYVVVINALFGLITFEYVWYRTRNYRNPIPELDALMPAYRRLDVHKWKKWKFYFGAMTLLYPRLIYAIL